MKRTESEQASIDEQLLGEELALQGLEKKFEEAQRAVTALPHEIHQARATRDRLAAAAGRAAGELTKALK